MKNILSYIFSSLVGIIFGILANYSFLNGSWLNLLVWAIVGLLIGFFIYEKKFIIPAGLCFGFFLTLSFLISGFHGASEKIGVFIIFSSILSVIGALCGWLLVFLGNWIKNIF